MFFILGVFLCYFHLVLSRTNGVIYLDDISFSKLVLFNVEKNITETFSDMMDDCSPAPHYKSIINIDLNYSISYAKVICHHIACLVKFDRQYRYGKVEDEFQKVALRVANNKDVLITELGTTDWGKKQNHVTRQLYNVSISDYPVFKLFLNNRKTIVTYSGIIEEDKLVEWIKEYSDVHIGSGTSTEMFENFAKEFVDATTKEDHDNASNFLTKIEEKLSESLDDNTREHGSIYLKILKKISLKGLVYVEAEHQRLENLLTTKLREDKKINLERKLDVLKVVRVFIKKSNTSSL